MLLTNSVYYQLEGSQTLYFILKICDDIHHYSTKDDGGRNMVDSAIEKMTNEKWKLTQENPTVDFDSLVHTFSTIGSLNTVALSQPT